MAEVEGRVLEEMLTWLDRLGAGINGNRIAIYRKIFETIKRHRRADTPEKMATELSPLEVANAFHELGELFQIWHGLKSFDNPIIRRKLAKAVTGTPMLFKELPNKSEPRNTLFELIIAALLRLAGVQIEFRDPDDVVARILHTPVLVECKRIQNPARFDERFDQAKNQLVTNLKNENSSRSRGIIAIDVSKTQNSGTSFLAAASSCEARASLTRVANEFCIQHLKVFQRPLSETIFAAIVYLRIPCFVRTDVLAALNSQFVQLIPLNMHAARNDRMFAALHAYLNRLESLEYLVTKGA